MNNFKLNRQKSYNVASWCRRIFSPICLISNMSNTVIEFTFSIQQFNQSIWLKLLFFHIKSRAIKNWFIYIPKHLNPLNFIRLHWTYFWYKVAWVRVDTQTILSIHHNLITQNHRISLTHNDHRSWYLHIKEVEEDDRGWYVTKFMFCPFDRNYSDSDMFKQLSHLPFFSCHLKVHVSNQYR